MNENQPETGIIIEEINGLERGNRLLVIGDCEHVSYGSKVKGVRLFNFDTGEIEIRRKDLLWYNWYHHPTGWDY